MESNRRYQAWQDRQAKAAEQASGDGGPEVATADQQVRQSCSATLDCLRTRHGNTPLSLSLPRGLLIKTAGQILDASSAQRHVQPQRFMTRVPRCRRRLVVAHLSRMGCGGAQASICHLRSSPRDVSVVTQTSTYRTHACTSARAETASSCPAERPRRGRAAGRR